MKMVLTEKVKGLDSKVAAIVENESMSKSGKMKELFRLGLEVKDIAVMLGVRYNFVYNVVSNMIIVEGIKVEQTRKASKKDKVWELFDQGKTVKEVAVELKTNYQYVYKLHKEWKDQAAKEVQAMESKEEAK
jgi:hypothetical protein